MHPEMVELMHLILDGAGGAEVRARLEGHLRACPDCTRAWASLRGVDAVLSMQAPLAPPAQFADKVMWRIAASSAATVRWERTRLGAALLALALAPLAAITAAGGTEVLQIAWSDSLSSLLSLMQWAAAGSAVLSTWSRVVFALLGAGPLVLSLMLGIALVIVWAHLLGRGRPMVRLG